MATTTRGATTRNQYDASPTWGIGNSSPGGGVLTGGNSGGSTGGGSPAAPSAPSCNSACQWGKAGNTALNIGALGLSVLAIAPDIDEALTLGDPEGIEGAGGLISSDWNQVAEDFANCGEGGPLSFASATLVATDSGEQAIGSLKPGGKVQAYNPTTKQSELEVIRHVWINHDDDLVDLTLTTKMAATKGKPAHETSETLHTNKKHPFLTVEKGFLPVAQLKLGMQVVESGGRTGVVTGWKSVPGAQTMYNLEVAQDHTYTVGDGQFVVHNTSCAVGDLDPLHSTETSGQRSELENLSDQELLNAANNPKNGDPIRINTNTGKVIDGNGRAYELIKRALSAGSSITRDTRIQYEPYTPLGIKEPWE